MLKAGSRDGMMNPHGHSFSHEALMYSGEEGFLEGTVPFIREAVDAGEPVLVMVGGRKIELLRGQLDGEAEGVHFADMAQVGLNPARIIPAWRDFVSDHAAWDHPMRGVGEPIWAGRDPAEVVECQRHESLLNVAFGDARAFRLLCPYDSAALSPDVIAAARRSHPLVVEEGARRPSPHYHGVEEAAAPFDRPLPDPPAGALEVAYDQDTLDAVRGVVSGSAAGLGARRAEDLALSIHELATNSVRHGGGGGALRVWDDGEALVCEVSDRGHLDQPLAGRECPDGQQVGGYGLWLVNQLCDLVQVRTFATGTVVRAHMRRDPGAAGG
jgi:anti-sigma regulatory factor (Ser/Thr protein kinase)